MRLRSTLLVGAAALAAAAAPAPAGADGGGVAAPEEAPSKQRPASGERGTTPLRRALLTSFEVRRRRLFLFGRSARVVFTLGGRPAAKVRLHVLNAVDGSRVASLELGDLAAGRHSIPFTGLETGIALPEGRYLLHMAGRNLRRGPTASSTAEVEFRHHTFPIAGPFGWGGEDARFGARREGHVHQGQDLTAEEGTPVVAPRGGVVEAVEYQAGGAGNYLVLDGEAEDRDYVFMHLRSGSIPVKAGDRVRTGQLIGEIGSTGHATGAHLHFEIWVGGWYDGGEPIDPLPLLRAWAS